MKFNTYQEWSEAFTAACKAVGEVEQVCDLWHANVPGDWKERSWKRPFGYGKHSKPGAENSGEKAVERKLLGDSGKLKDVKLHRDGGEYQLTMAYHNFPLTSQRKGQVVADILAVASASRRQRPLLVEVKTTDHYPWYALVECLKQVRLARLSKDRICKMLNRHIDPVDLGAWGLIVAPPPYFRKEMAACDKLFDELKRSTYARIAFSKITDKDSELFWVAGNWEKPVPTKDL
jgi:hypothetical protein